MSYTLTLLDRNSALQKRRINQHGVIVTVIFLKETREGRNMWMH